MWHRDKDFIAKEMNQLQKVKMQQVLREIEEDEDNRKDRQFYGDTAFKQWLDCKALPEKLTGPPSSRKKGGPSKVNESTMSRKGSKVSGSEKRAPLHKANSLQLPANRSARTPIETPVSRDETERVRAKTPSEDKNKKNAPEVKFVEPDQPISGTDGEKPSKTEGNPAYINTAPWNKSPKTPIPEYVKMLPDHYPRDIYTSLPKYPATRKRPPKPTEKQHLLRLGPGSDDVFGDGQSPIRMPQLPADMIEKVLGNDASKKEKRIVFKCENIIDVQTRKHFDPDADGIHRPEIGLHFTNQIESRVFKAALQQERLLTTPSTIISGVSSSRSSTSSRSNGTLKPLTEGVASLKSLVDKHSKTASYAQLTVPVISPKASQPVV